MCRRPGCQGVWSNVSLSGNQQRQRRMVHRSSRSSPRSGAETPTRHVACGVSIAPLQANAMSGRSAASCACLAATLWSAFCPSGSSSSWSRGALGLAPPALVCGRAAWSPSSATASSACRGSASHVSPESLYVRHRSQVPIWLSAPPRASRSASVTASQGRHHIQRRGNRPHARQ